jgi:hypothetical protein
MSEEITPFRIEIPEADLDDLRRRLRLAYVPDLEILSCHR